MLVSSFSSSSIGSLLGLALLFGTLWEFYRGMRALAQIATSLERIEHILTKGPPAVPDGRHSTRRFGLVSPKPPATPQYWWHTAGGGGVRKTGY